MGDLIEEVTRTYPKYQYSRFIGEDQIVVRTDLKEEFEEMVEYVRGFGKVADPTDSWKVPNMPTGNVTADNFYENHICPTHKTQMVEKVSSKTNKPYWSHMEVINGKRSICFGKGWK